MKINFSQFKKKGFGNAVKKEFNDEKDLKKNSNIESNNLKISKIKVLPKKAQNVIRINANEPHNIINLHKQVSNKTIDESLSQISRLVKSGVQSSDITGK